MDNSGSLFIVFPKRQAAGQKVRWVRGPPREQEGVVRAQNRRAASTGSSAASTGSHRHRPLVPARVPMGHLQQHWADIPPQPGHSSRVQVLRFQSLPLGFRSLSLWMVVRQMRDFPTVSYTSPAGPFQQDVMHCQGHAGSHPGRLVAPLGMGRGHE